MTTRKQLVRAGVIAKHDATCLCSDDISTYHGWTEVERILDAVLPLIAADIEACGDALPESLVSHGVLSYRDGMTDVADRVRSYLDGQS